jgi:hypothetical protein
VLLERAVVGEATDRWLGLRPRRVLVSDLVADVFVFGGWYLVGAGRVLQEPWVLERLVDVHASRFVFDEQLLDKVFAVVGYAAKHLGWKFELTFLDVFGRLVVVYAAEGGETAQAWKFGFELKIFKFFFSSL